MYCTLQTQSNMQANTAVMQDGEEPDYFCWLLNRVMPWAGGYAVVLEAYFDASKRDGGQFCVAGFAFGEDRAKKATRDWMRLWGDERCHMTDLHTRKPNGRFAGWSDGQAGKRLEACTPIMNSAASFAVAVSCNVDEVERLAPKLVDPGSRALLGGFRSAYGVCCHAAMASLARMTGGQGGIAYFFESGDEYQGESQAFIAQIAAVPEVARRLYGRRSHAVLDKQDCRLFEMSDILAWEWAKHVQRVANGDPMRPSLRALLGEDLQKKGETNVGSAARRGWHLTGAPLEHYFQLANDMELFSDHPSDAALEKLLAGAEAFRALT